MAKLKLGGIWYFCLCVGFRDPRALFKSRTGSVTSGEAVAKVPTHGSAPELMQLHSKYGKCFLSPQFQVRRGGDLRRLRSCSRPCCQELLLALKLRKKKRIWEIPAAVAWRACSPHQGSPQPAPAEPQLPWLASGSRSPSGSGSSRLAGSDRAEISCLE